MSKKKSNFNEKNKPITIKNPISNDLDIMRQSIIPNLLDAAYKNISNGEDKVCLFELGPVFDDKYSDQQQIFLSGIRCGQKKKHWLKKERFFDVFDVKADLESILFCCKLPENHIQ